MCGQQVFLDRFTFSCVRSTSFSCTVFLVHLSGFPWRPHTQTNFPCPKAGITGIGTRLPGKEAQANKTCQGKLVCCGRTSKFKPKRTSSLGSSSLFSSSAIVGSGSSAFFSELLQENEKERLVATTPTFHASQFALAPLEDIV